MKNLKIYISTFVAVFGFMLIGILGNTNASAFNPGECNDTGCLEGHGPDGVACYFIPGLHCELQSSTECTTKRCSE